MKNIALISRETLSAKRYPLEQIHYSWTTESGELLEKKVEVYERPSAATVLLIDPSRRCVLLTEQLRLPAFINGGRNSLVEACAGMIEDGEEPAETIHREVEEELGYAVADLQALFSLYSSPGGNTELIYYFFGTYSVNERLSEGGGKKNEGEAIEPVEWTFEEAFEKLRSGTVRDAKTVILLQHAAINGIFDNKPSASS